MEDAVKFMYSEQFKAASVVPSFSKSTYSIKEINAFTCQAPSSLKIK
jgi:hypothetical protein